MRLTLSDSSLVLERAVALALALALGSYEGVVAQDPEHPAPAVSASIASSAAEGLSARLRLSAAGMALRVEADRLFQGGDDAGPGATMSLSFPLLFSGHARPRGLLAFLYQPASTSRFLSGAGGVPLQSAGLSDATLLGAAVGDGLGFFGALPSRRGEPEPGSEAYGLWFAPRESPLSLLFVASSRPARPGGPLWYDTPEPPSARWHTGAGLTMGERGSWSLSAAGAAYGACPGAGPPGGLPFVDGGAARAEGALALGRWRLEAALSATSRAWSGIGGASSEALKAACELRYLGRSLALSAAYRYGLDTRTPVKATNAIRGGASFSSRIGTIGCSGSMDWGASTVVTLDSSFQPGFVSGLRVATSWRAVDGETTRFDATARLSMGERPRLSADLGLRFLPEGRSVKASLACSLPARSLSLGCELSTDGWIPFDSTEIAVPETPFQLAASAWASLSL